MLTLKGNELYYLEIKIGSINESNQIPSTLQPFWNNYFEQEEGKRGSLCIKHGTLSIVSHYITLHHIVFCHIIWYHILSNYHTKLDPMIGPPQIVAMYLQVLLRGFGLSLDTRDSNAYVSRAKRTRCYAETVTLPRANFVVWSMVIGHTAIYILKSLPLETWQFPHSNAYVSREKHTRSNHACPFQAQSETVVLYKYCA